MSLKGRSFVLLFLFASVLFAGASQASAATTVTSVPFGGNINGPSPVYPSWIDSRTSTGWTSYVERDQSAAANHGFRLVTGPATPPIGSDSAEVSNGPDTPAGGNKSYLVGPGAPFVGQPLSALFSLKWGAYSHQAVNPYLSFEINPGAGTNKTFSGLTFDPGLGSPIPPNAWNQYDGMEQAGPTSHSGQWWFTSTITLGHAVTLSDGTSSGTVVGGGGGPNIGSQDHPLSIDNIERIVPNATFIFTGPALVVGQTGTGNGNSVDNFDNVTLGVGAFHANYNFEKAIPTVLIADPLLIRFSPIFGLPVLSGLTAHLFTSGGAPVANAPIVFSKAGQYLCTGFTNAAGAANCAPFLSLSQILALLNLGYDATFYGLDALQPSHAPGKVTT